jgi:polar amino acid transport system substrate-binding protein
MVVRTSGPRRWFGALAVALLALVAVAGCGSSKKSSTSASTTKVTKNAKVAAAVPAPVKKKGTLVVAADATYPPNEFIASNGHTVIGMDADLADALTKVMGLKAKIVNATFDAIIPGLAAKKYDLGMSSFTDTKEREKTVDFVTYLIAGTEFYVKKQGGPTINTLADLCGHKVAVEKGTTQQDDTTAQVKKCKTAGKPALKVLVFPDQNGVNLALSSGRAQVAMADSPVADYIVKKSNGQFKVVGKVYGTAPYGIAIPKGNGMTKPILDGLKVLISNGTYTAILQKWGIHHFAIKNPKINGAVS